MTAVGLVTHPDYMAHETGRTHPERPERLRAVIEHLAATGLTKDLSPIEPVRAGLDSLERIHGPAYIRRVEEHCRAGRAVIDSMDTDISARSYEVSLLAVGGGIAAADAIMEGAVRRAFA
ncbi:MAG TPA: histone deacetylase, partial [Candidatus Polarisedimenticolia bacterium]|nr:histone deacetylase [Candidatus Polarisedimenticolia bacterium]